jgi:hypothetical protein
LAEALLGVIPLRLNRYSDFFRRAAQYFFIRRLTARRAAADIFRRARRARAGLPLWRPRPSLPSKALIAWVSLATSRSRADRSERSCCTNLPKFLAINPPHAVVASSL